jgi:hypothetical protein
MSVYKPDVMDEDGNMYPTPRGLDFSMFRVIKGKVKK